MGLVLAGLAGASGAASGIAGKYIDEEFEVRRQANLERLALAQEQRSNNEWDRRHSVERTDAQADLEATTRKFKQGTDQFGAYQEDQFGNRDYHFKQGSHASSKGWDTKTLVVDGVEYEVPFNKDTGEFDYSSPMLHVPTMSQDEAMSIAQQEAEDKATYRHFDSTDFNEWGGSRDAFIAERASQLVEGSKPINQLKPGLVAANRGQQSGGESNGRPRTSFEKKPPQSPKQSSPLDKYMGEIDDTKLLGLLDTYGDVKQSRQYATVKRQFSNPHKLRSELKGDEFVAWAKRAIKIAEEAGDKSLAATIESQLNNIPR